MSFTKIDLEKAVDDGIITTAIRDHLIQWNQKNTGDVGSRFIQIFSVFGSLAIWLWVMLLVAANWDGISDSLKTIIMIGSTLIMYIAGYHFSYRDLSYPKTGQALIFLGSMLYGGSIMLLGQIYNLGWSFDQALLIWAIWVFPLAYFTRFSSLFLLALTLLYAYVFAKMSYSWYISGFLVANVFILLGLISLLISRIHRERWLPVFAKVLSWTGMLSLLSWLFAYTFTDFWNSGSTSWWWVAVSTTPYVLSGVVFATLWLAIYLYDAYTRYKRLDMIDGVVILGSLAIIGFLVMTSLSVEIRDPYDMTSSYDTYSISVRALTMNILYLALLGWLIWMGIRRDRLAFINISMIFLAVYLFGRYLAFVFESKVDGAIVFIGGGVICLLLTFLVEKIRRRIVASLIH